MIAAIGAAVVGGLYSPIMNLGNLLIFCIGVFAALYFAHVKDSYVDYFERHEDKFSDLTKRQAQAALVICAIVVVMCAIYFVSIGFWIAAPIIAAGLLLAFFHAPLDLNPIGATTGYPTGLALAAIGGYYVQAGVVPLNIILFAIAIWIILNGVKIVDDIKDYDWDKNFGKITAPVLLGKMQAKKVAVVILLLGATMGVVLSLIGVLPKFVSISFLPIYAAGFLSWPKNDKKSLYGLYVLLIGVYLFLFLQIALFAFGLN